MWEVIAGVFLLAFLAACDAERDNPYDPKSPYYKPGGVVTGWVKTRTGMPIEGAEILVEPDDHSGFSDAVGFYEIKGLVTENSKVTASKQGYSSEDTMLNVILGKKNTADFYLDILPEFVACSVSTRHKSNGRYYAFFQTEVNDSDGTTGLEDIADVSLYIKGFDTIDLKYFVPRGTYRSEMEDSCFSADSLRSLIGKDCFFIVRDKVGEVVVSDPFRAIRIIDAQPKVVWPPKGLNHTGPSPELVWERFEESFSYTYTVNIIDDNDEVTEYYSRIPSETLSVKVKKVLSPGVYNWTVTVIDEFGNESESESGSFIVE